MSSLEPGREPEPSRVAIMGSSGRIGRLVVEHALSTGQTLAVLRRTSAEDADPRIRVVVGDVRDARAIEELVTGSRAVIAALGPRANTAEQAAALESGMRNVVKAMERGGVSRLVTLSGAAVSVPDDDKPLLDRFVTRIVRLFARHVVDSKQREYAVMASSGLEWTALRPPLVTDGEAQGYLLDMRLRPGARVRRADVARALLDQVDDRTFVRRAPFVLPPRR